MTPLERQVRSCVEEANRALDERDHHSAAALMVKVAGFAAELSRGMSGTRKDRYVEMASRLKREAQGLLPQADAPANKDERTDGEGKSEWIITQRPEVSFDDIIGLDNLKAKIKNYVSRMENPSELEKWPLADRGDRLLLFGPPGTGKTMFAKAIASEVDGTFFNVSGASIFSKWLGDSEKRVGELFALARSKRHPVLFIDEIEALLSSRDGEHAARDGVITEFLQELDGIKGANENLLFIGATNLPAVLDSALLSRFRGGLYYLRLPNLEEREALLRKLFTSALPYGFSEEIDIPRLAAGMEGFSMRDLAGMVREISNLGSQRGPEEGDGKISLQDVESVRANMVATTRPSDLKAFQAIAAREAC